MLHSNVNLPGPSPTRNATRTAVPRDRTLRHPRDAGRRMRTVPSLLVAALLFAAVPRASAQPAPVTVEPVRNEALGSTVRVTGSLHAVSRAGVATQEPGLVMEVLVDVGSTVVAGDVLARLDDRRMRAELTALAAERRTAEAQQREAEADAEFAEREFDRVKRLADRGQASDIELVRVRTTRDATQARISAAEQSIARIQAREELLRIRLSDTEVTAPFDGVVVERAVDPGEWLSAGDAVATVVSTGVHEAWLEIPERYVADVAALGSNLDVQSAATGEALRTLRVRLMPQVDPRVRTFMAIADVTSGNGALLAGMSVTAWVPTSAVEERLTIHKDALIRDASGFLVFAARERGDGHVATPIPVKVAFETETRAALHPGALREGELVVVEGNERLYAGAPIVPTSVPEPAVSVASDGNGGTGE